jgi:hypothetical protein
MHDHERAAQHRRAGLGEEDSRSGDVGVLGQRAHHQRLTLEVVLREQPARSGGRHPRHEPLLPRLTILHPGGVEQHGLARQSARRGYVEVGYPHLLRTRQLVSEPGAQRELRLFGVQGVGNGHCQPPSHDDTMQSWTCITSPPIFRPRSEAVACIRCAVSLITPARCLASNPYATRFAIARQNATVR